MANVGRDTSPMDLLGKGHESQSCRGIAFPTELTKVPLKINGWKMENQNTNIQGWKTMQMIQMYGDFLGVSS